MHKYYQTRVILLFSLCIISFAGIAAVNNSSKNFSGSISPIPTKVWQSMQHYTWRKGCPIGRNQLAYVKLSYWGFDNKVHRNGVLIVNKDRAREVLQIFKQLFKQYFPIYSIKPAYIFKGNDDASMAADNTSAFNCRRITNDPRFFSLHSYGWAIDINPVQNPYVGNYGRIVLPTAGNRYLNRNWVRKGMIVKGDAVYKDFTSRGWSWLGDRPSRPDIKDYQHFEKTPKNFKFTATK